jgi:hypothetical protein
VLPTQWNGSWFKKQRTAFFKKAMKWDSVAVAEHNHSLGATRYSPSPLPHSRLHHMPLLTHSRPHYVPLLPHCRPHHMPLLPHARPHHCCLTIAASLCILTTAVSLLAPDSDGEETKEHNNSLGEPAYLHMSRDTLLRFYNKHSCSHCWSDIAALVLLLAHVLSYCWCHIAALILLLSYVTCCIHTTHTVD